MDSELQRFVRESLARGLARAAIRDRLLAAGWRPSEIDAALAAYAEDEFPVPVPRRRPYIPARVAFLHLVLFATLYVTAYNVGAVLFALIERWLPDATAPYGGRIEIVRSAVASLVIALPVFLWMNRLIARGFVREPEQRGSSVRKWLTYLTLFLAALVLIGDLVFLVTRLLSGELPPRVLLKVAVVFAIAGVVFWHYLRDLQTEESDSHEPAARASWIARIAVIAAILVVAGGLWASGSPQRARRVALDEQRSNDLQTLSGELDRYWQDRGVLPDSLTGLADLPQGPYRLVATDPVTHEAYGYRTLDSTSYELCATFDAASEKLDPATEGRQMRSRFHEHTAGRVCFPVRVSRIRRP